MAVSVETAGYIALAMADAVLRSPTIVHPGRVQLTVRGEVAVFNAEQAANLADVSRAVRGILAELLCVSSGNSPSLEACARRSNSTDLGSLIAELEAALVPVNRAAARRNIARLVREVTRTVGDLSKLATVSDPPRPVRSQGQLSEPPAYSFAKDPFENDEFANNRANYVVDPSSHRSRSNSRMQFAPTPPALARREHAYEADPVVSIAPELIEPEAVVLSCEQPSPTCPQYEPPCIADCDYGSVDADLAAGNITSRLVEPAEPFVQLMPAAESVTARQPGLPTDQSFTSWQGSVPQWPKNEGERHEPEVNGDQAGLGGSGVTGAVVDAAPLESPDFASPRKADITSEIVMIDGMRQAHEQSLMPDDDQMCCDDLHEQVSTSSHTPLWGTLSYRQRTHGSDELSDMAKGVEVGKSQGTAVVSGVSEQLQYRVSSGANYNPCAQAFSEPYSRTCRIFLPWTDPSQVLVDEPLFTYIPPEATSDARLDFAAPELAPIPIQDGVTDLGIGAVQSKPVPCALSSSGAFTPVFVQEYTEYSLRPGVTRTGAAQPFPQSSASCDTALAVDVGSALDVGLAADFTPSFDSPIAYAASMPEPKTSKPRKPEPENAYYYYEEQTLSDTPLDSVLSPPRESSKHEPMLEHGTESQEEQRQSSEPPKGKAPPWWMGSSLVFSPPRNPKMSVVLSVIALVVALAVLIGLYVLFPAMLFGS